MLIGVVWLGTLPCSAEIEVTDVRFECGEWVTPPGELTGTTAVDHLTAGDQFIVFVDVSNAGPAAETVFNLFDVRFSPVDAVQALASLEPCVGLFPIDLQPGESASLRSSLPCAAAFRARKAGSVTLTMEITTGFGLDEHTVEVDITALAASCPRLEGVLEIFIVDDFVNRRSETLFYLNVNGRDIYSLVFDSGDEPQSPGSSIAVEGMLDCNNEVFYVDRWETLEQLQDFGSARAPCLDDDGDEVNNCEDACPDTWGSCPDGCPARPTGMCPGTACSLIGLSLAGTLISHRRRR